MVAIVSGNGLGVLNSSAAVLGQLGNSGTVHGNSKETAYLNIFSGNLSLADSDDFLAAHGVNVELTRTYNAQGSLNTGNGANWQYGLSRQVNGLTGTANSAGSTVLRTAGDGSAARYTYDTVKAAYIATDGAGSYQSITFNATTKEWTWRADRNDLQGTVEIYDSSSNGRLTSVRDLVGVRQTLRYDAVGRLSQVTDATGAAGLAADATNNGNDQTYFDYDAAGNLSQIRHRLSSGLTSTRAHYTYDGQNRLSTASIDLTPDDNSVTDGQVYTTTYAYDGASNRIASVTQSDGTALQFKYYLVGTDWKVSSFTDGLGQKTTLDYSVPGRTTVTDALGLATVYGYDGQGRLTDVASPPPVAGAAALVTRFFYDTSGNVTHVTDARGLDTTYGYDANGNRILERDAAGNTVTRAYNLVTNQLLAEARFLTPDADGAGAGVASVPLTMRYTYDASGRLHFQLSPEGRITEFRYNALGELASELHYSGQLYSVAALAVLAVPTDAQVVAAVAAAAVDKTKLQRIDYGYDARGLRSTVTRYANTSAAGEGLIDGQQSTIRYVYDQAGNVLGSYDGNNNLSSTSYDGLGRKLLQTDALGNTVLNVYDALSNLTVVTTAAQATAPVRTISYVHDAAGQLLSITQQAGQQSGTTSYAYDADGRLRVSTGVSGQKTYWLYDGAGRTVAQIENNGGLTEFLYNADGQVTRTIRYAAAADTAKLATAKGQPLAATLDDVRPLAGGDDRNTWNSYDSAGRLVASVDANGYLTRLVYDGASRVTQTIARALPIDVSKLDGLTIAASYVGEASADDRISRTLYDLDGNVTGRLDAAGFLTENRYNAAGQLLETIAYDTMTAVAQRPSGALAALRPALASADVHQRYLYNGAGQLVGSIDGDNYLTELTYDAAGNIASRRSYANAVTTPAALTLALLGKTVAVDDRVSLYSYTVRNQLASETTLAGTFVNYAYDSDGNLIAQASGAVGAAARNSLMIYDGAGRLVAQLGQEGVAKLAALGATPIAAEVEKIWAVYAQHYSYNAAGQRVSASDAMGNRTLYFYDDMGRPAATVTADGQVQEHRYDLDGLLVKSVQYAKRLDASALATLNGGSFDGDFASALLQLASVSQDRASVFYYDSNGRLIYSVNAGGQVAGQNYNAFGQVAQSVRYITGYSGTALRALNGGRGADALAELAGIPNTADGNDRLQSYYDADGRLIYSVDASGEVAAQTWNGIGLVATVSQYGARLTAANLASLTGTSADIAKLTALGAKATRTTLYNHRGQVTDVSDALLNHTLTTYNGFGEVSKRTALATSASLATSALDLSLRTLYDLAGRVLATIDGSGALTYNQYDSAGRLSERTTYASRLAAADVAGATAANIATLAAALSKVGTASDPANDQRVRYFYENGLVGATATLQRIGTTQQWSVVAQQYDRNGNVVVRTAYATPLQVNDPEQADVAAIATSKSDAISQFVFDSMNRVVTQAVAQGSYYDAATWAVTTITYDAAGNVSSRTQRGQAPADLTNPVPPDPEVDRTTRYGYDALNRLRYTIDAEGGVTGIDYNALGSVVAVTAYHTASTLTGTIAGDYVPAASAMDRISRSVYDLNGRPVYDIDALGAVTEHRYDAYGNLSANIAYATPLSAVAQAGLGAATSSADLKGLVRTDTGDRTERRLYDLNGRLRYAVDSGGFLTETQYNALGQVIKTLAYQTAKVYGEATLATDVAAQVTAQAATARVTSYTYDAQGNLATATDPLLAKQSYTYDALGRKTSYTNALNKTWNYKYDAAGHNIEEDSPLFNAYVEPMGTAMGTWGAGGPTTLITVMEYDALGNLSSRTEGSSSGQPRTTSYKYDRVGRQTEIITPLANVYEQNAQADADGRKEMPRTGSIWVIYDNFGDAMEHHDVNGAISYKSYDKMGRLVYDIDAIGNVTGYERDAFGGVTALTRYNLTQRVGPYGGPEAIRRRLVLDHANDRTIITSYDLNGNAVKFSEPAVAIYDARATGGRYLTASRTTETTYNAFNQAIHQQVYGADPITGRPVTESSSTRYYYDLAGRKSAEINALSDTASSRSGYLTNYEYDAAGNLTKQIEFNSPTTWTETAYTAALTTDALNRTTQYTYDKTDHLTTESKIGVSYANASGAAVTGNLTTSYAYDLLGRQVSSTDALSQVTNTYYDELGRISAVSMKLTATTAQLTEFKRDIYGNALLRIEYANAATTASGGSNTVAPLAQGLTAAANRVTATSYDINGRAIRVLDAEQYANKAADKASYLSYDLAGHMIRQWRLVTDEGVTRTSYQLNSYDALGRLWFVQTPGNLNLVDGTTSADIQKVSVFNAFGEVTATQSFEPANNKLVTLSTTRYDQAGHAWFSNAGEGIDTVFLYDARGNATAQIRSSNADQGKTHELAGLANAMAALGVAQQLRTDNQYDLTGRLVNSSLVTEQVSVLRWQNGAWINTTPAYSDTLTDSLIVIGQRDDAGKTFEVRYKLKPDGAVVIDKGSRLHWIDGYPVFNTGGLPAGDYSYEVYATPAGENQYLASSGGMHISVVYSSEKDKQVVALYMLLLGRPPAPAELNYWIASYNQGLTLAELAGNIYLDKEASAYRGAGNGEAVRKIFQTIGKLQPDDDDYPAAVALWIARLDPAGNSPLALGLVLAALLDTGMPALASRVNAVTNYLVQGGSDVQMVNNLLAHADTAPDGAIAEGSRAAQLETQRVQLARLYLTLFARAPDKAGFDFWVAGLANGTDTIDSVAQQMLAGSEAKSGGLLTDSLGPDQYNDKLVKLAYANLLGRAPTADELAREKSRLGAPPSGGQAAFLVRLGAWAAGAPDEAAPLDTATRTMVFNKVTVCLAYAAMPSLGPDTEQIIAINKAAIAAMSTADSAAAAAHQATLFLQAQAVVAQAAIATTTLAAGATPLETLRLQLARAYAVALNRAPDRDGYTFWLAQLKGGAPDTLLGIVADMLAHEGGNAALYPPSLSATDFVTRIFTSAMGLQPGSAALASAVAAWVPLAATRSRAQLMLDIINSVVGSSASADQPMRNLLNNKAAVGVTYAVNFAGVDITQEKNILALVTDSDISAALQYGNTSAMQLAADSALATAAAAKASAAQASIIVGAVGGIVTAQAKVTPAQTAANANALSAPLLRAAQLYVTMLMRGTPGYADLDLTGVSNMMQQMQAGATDVAMAQSILDSAEGRALFPSANYNPTLFVTQMFRQALGRDPDAAGLAFWVAAAQTPASRAQIAVDMVKSFLTDPVADDNQNKQPNQLAQAAFYDKMSAALTKLSTTAAAAVTALNAAVVAATDADTKAKAVVTTATAATAAATNAAATNARKVLEVSRLFVGLLNRGAPNIPIDISGLNFWTRARVQGTTLETIANDFLTSDEGRALYAGATTNQAFISQIYQQVLGRAPAQGDNFWLSQLNAGASRALIASSIVTSLTEQTYQAESEYLAKANFDQRVGDAMKVLAGTAATGASAAAADLAAKLALKNSTATTLTNSQKALTTANALTVEADPAVIAAKAAAPRGAAFLASANVKAVTELLVAFNRPSDFTTVYNLISGSLTSEALLLSIIKPLALTTLADRNAFITDLYNKILKRPPDAAGLNWWVSGTMSLTDPAKVAYEFFKGCLPELYGPIAGVSQRIGFKAEFDAVNTPNLAQATSMANGYAPAQQLAAAQIAQKRSDAQAAYNNAVLDANKAASDWSYASSYNDVAKVAGTALASAGTVQTATVTADKAAAASFAAAAKMPGIAAGVGMPEGSKLADYSARSALMLNVQKASTLDATLDTAQAALARANAVRTTAVQDQSVVTILSRQTAAITQYYTALLNRAPTLAELYIAQGSLKLGKTTDDLSAALIAANPAVYPLTMTNDAFVTKVYSQAMGRAPDTAGLRFWSDQLAGANPLGRGTLVMRIISSLTVENLNSDNVTYNNRVVGYLTALATQAQDSQSTPAKALAAYNAYVTANTVTARTEATAFDAAKQAALPAAGLYETELTQLYLALLGRAPEPSALLSAVAQRVGGTTLLALAQGIADSTEARLRFAAGASDSQFIQDFYALGLGRPADDAELAAGVALLAGGKNSRSQVVLTLIKDLVAYNAGDAMKAAARTNFMGKVSVNLERSVNEVWAYASQLQTTAQRSADMERVSILTRLTNGTLLGRDSSSSALATQNAPRTTLDRWGNVLTITDARNPNWKISYVYNYNNQQIDQTLNALAGDTKVAHTRTSYDALGRAVASTDYNGNTTRYGYDNNGQLLLEAHADGGQVTHEYNLFGERLSTKRWDSATTGVQMYYAYDHLSHLTSTKTAAAVAVYVAINTGSSMDLDDQGARQLEERFEYDELGRRVHSIDASGVNTYRRYDLDGNLIMTKTQGDLYRTVTAYDAFHHRTATLDALNHKMTWTVDSFGRTSQFADISGTVTDYSYDAAGRLTLTSINGSTISQTYENGLLVRIVNSESRLTTTYTYDVVGNRLSEKQTYAGDSPSVPAQVQNNKLKYDMQNRLTDVQDDTYTLKYTYDNNGNRASITTTYFGAAAFTKYNAYDEMNRQTVVNADAWDAAQKTAVLGKTGHQIVYDKAGNRVSDSYIGMFINKANFAVTSNTLTTETYAYDGAGRLQYSYRDGVLFDSRSYDASGRVTVAGEQVKASDASRRATYAAGIASQRRTFSYDSGGHITRQQDFNYDAPNQDVYFVVDQWNTKGGYDAMGNLTGYTVVVDGTRRSDNGTYQIEYIWTDSAREKLTKLTSNNTTVSSVYDNFGNRIQVIGEQGQLQKQFWYDADGHVQSRMDDGKAGFSLIVNGQVLGDENARDDNILGSAYQPANAASLQAPPSAYSVQSNNETLQSIAQAVWGDAKLWYLIADANGLSSESALKVGDILRIPTRVNTVHSDYATFKPYNASEAIGNTAPALPPPSHGGGCGAVGTLIMIVVAVVVTIYTAGAMTSAVAGFANTMAAGATALGGGLAAGGVTLAGVGIGAAAAAAGSVASQLVGMAIGAQDGFDWKGVAMAAIGGGVSGSLPANIGGVTGGYQSAIARAAVSSVVVQGASIAVGLQNGFQWRSVAVSAAGAAAGQAFSGSTMLSQAFGDSQLAQSTVSGFASGVTASIARGGKIEIARIATDAFGNALGSSLASMASGGEEQATNKPKTFQEDIEERSRSIPGWTQLKTVEAASQTDSQYQLGGGYDPQDLLDGGYPEDARFIDTPTDKTGRPIQGVGTTSKGAFNPNALDRKTYPFGDESDASVATLVGQIDRKVPRNNSAELVTNLQEALGMEGKGLSGFLDKSTYRAIRDWKVDFEDRKSTSIAEALLTQSIRPALQLLDLQSGAMENLLLGTAIHESGTFEYRKQTVGPALSLFQIEPDTANFYMNSLKKNDLGTYTKINSLGSGNIKDDLANNDKFSAAIAAVIYDDRLTKRSITLPESSDIRGLGEVWKQLYNTPRGKGTVDQFVNDWNQVFKKK